MQYTQIVPLSTARGLHGYCVFMKGHCSAGMLDYLHHSVHEGVGASIAVQLECVKRAIRVELQNVT